MTDEISIEFPEQLENLQLPDPNLTLWWNNAINNRTFWIDFDIGQELLSIERMISDINREDQNVPVENRKPIVVWVYSYGGEVDPTLSFLDVCELSKTPIITINAGVAMSAGLLILLAGHKRYGLKRSRALVHSGSVTGLSGTYEQSEAAMRDYKRSIQIIRDYILERTQMDEKLYAKNKSKEWYLDSDGQLANGVIHEILNDLVIGE